MIENSLCDDASSFCRSYKMPVSRAYRYSLFVCFRPQLSTIAFHFLWESSAHWDWQNCLFESLRYPRPLFEPTLSQYWCCVWLPYISSMDPVRSDSSICETNFHWGILSAPMVEDEYYTNNIILHYSSMISSEVAISITWSILVTSQFRSKRLLNRTNFCGTGSVIIRWQFKPSVAMRLDGHSGRGKKYPIRIWACVLWYERKAYLRGVGHNYLREQRK